MDEVGQAVNEMRIGEQPLERENSHLTHAPSCRQSEGEWSLVGRCWSDESARGKRLQLERPGSGSCQANSRLRLLL